MMSEKRGTTLTELMVAVSLITIGVIGSMGAFKYINRAMGQSRLKTIATNIAQEKMEILRNKSYFQLLVTTSTAYSSGFSPNFVYDTENYPPETITLWGFPPLTRYVNVDYVALTGSSATILSYTANDPGMKKITVYVTTTFNGVPKKFQIDSYYENPNVAVMSAGFRGQVTNAADGAGIADALVQVMGSPKWRAYTDPSGNYNFQVVPGTYTLVCSTQGYFPGTSGTLSVSANAYTPKDFSLYKVSTGSVSGQAYIRDHLVISQVVASTIMVSGVDMEYVELYNPTTWTINVGPSDVRVRYLAENPAHNVNELKLSANFSIGPGRYGLLTNSFPLTVMGASPLPNAQFGSILVNPTCDLHNFTTNCIREDESGAVQIYDNSGVLDTVGWTRWPKTPPAYEGTPVTEVVWMGGFSRGYQLRRNSEYNHVTPGVGRAYDSNSNADDFIFLDMNNAWASPPYWTGSGVMLPSGGTPAAGAVVTCGDGLSSSALVSATGYFFLTNIATSTVQGAANTWTIDITSYAVMGSSSGVTVPANQNRDLGTIVLSTAVTGGIATGYVYGSGPYYSTRLGNIKVGSGGEITNTDSQGFYLLRLSTGLVTISGNYGSSNGSYQSSDVDVTTVQGTITPVPDFHLAQGGYITGYVTSGTGALPNVVVQATNGGPVYEDTSDITGHFYLYVTTSASAYTVSPVLDPVQSYTSLPATPLLSTLLVPGSTVFAGTITVVGATGAIAGAVTNSGAAITTGVLVVASTAAVNDPLSAIAAYSAPAQAVFYSVSSQADGTYSLDVRASSTTAYNVRAFYPVVNTVTGVVTYTSKPAASVWVSTAGAVTQRDFSWP